MEKLTIEEKAKAYDIALDKLKRLFGTGDNCTREDAEYIFPELADSKDERIRKGLIDFLEYYRLNNVLDSKTISLLTDSVAWLEKQGEQKSTDKVEPKFKVGDWVVVDGVTQQVTQIRPNGFDTDRAWNGKLTFKDVHLWTIQDAKAGDVLCTYECCNPKIVFILKGTPKKHYALSYHCYYNIMYPHFGSDSEKGCLAPNDEDVKPATKEQSNLLFQKMNEAGYEWDADKKELKKIEQKPAAWSEEDNMMLQYAIEHFERQKRNCVEGGGRKKAMQEFIDWLKSLKDRIQPQPMQEWSEEDEKMLERLTKWMKGDIGFLDENIQKYISWLKSIRPQSQWKPSDEQMNTLWDAIVFVEGCNSNFKGSGSVLENLYNNLKKLRKE